MSPVMAEAGDAKKAKTLLSVLCVAHIYLRVILSRVSTEYRRVGAALEGGLHGQGQHFSRGATPLFADLKESWS